VDFNGLNFRWVGRKDPRSKNRVVTIDVGNVLNRKRVVSGVGSSFSSVSSVPRYDVRGLLSRWFCQYFQ
jgi:hypothetical protein